MAGNKNSGRKPNEKLVAQNLSIILDELDPSTDRKRMLNVLHALVEQAEAGSIAHAKELFDRLEGKVPQGVIGGGDNGEFVFRIGFE